MGCERHKLHIYRTGNVESLHFETSQMECGRLIREDQPAFFISQFCLPNGYGDKKCRNSHRRIADGCPTETRTQSNRTKIWCATITPWGNRFFCVFAGAKIRDYSDISKFFGKNLSHLHEVCVEMLCVLLKIAWLTMCFDDVDDIVANLLATIDDVHIHHT